MGIVHYYRMEPDKVWGRKGVLCSEEEYSAWAAKCKGDPFYATSRAGDYRRMFVIEEDD